MKRSCAEPSHALGLESVFLRPLRTAGIEERRLETPALPDGREGYRRRQTMEDGERDIEGGREWKMERGI